MNINLGYLVFNLTKLASNYCNLYFKCYNKAGDKMAYTIQCADEEIAQEYFNKIYAKNNVSVDLLNMMEFDCREVEIEKIIDYCETTPFFADNKIVILKHPIFLTGQKDRKDYTSFIEGLKKYLENENSSTLFIIYANYESLDERKSIVKWIKDNTNFKKVEQPNKLQLINIISKMLKAHNCSMKENDIDYLISKVGNNLADLSSEVAKLITYKKEGLITRDDMEEFIVFDINSRIFELSNAILNKDISHSITLYEELLNEGEEPIVLISILASQIRTALLCKNYLKVGLNKHDMVKKIKVHPYKIDLALKLKFNETSLKDTLLKLADLDYKIKTGQVNKYHGLKVFILSI